jgi:hypothetical protein
MELNLTDFYCSSFRIDTECTITPELFSKIKCCSNLKEEEIKEKGIGFGNKYNISKKRHTAFAVIINVEKEKKYFIQFSYRTGSFLKKGVKLEPVSALLNCLKEQDEEVNFDCGLRFIYPTSLFNSIIPIPIKVQSPIFDEIRGFRLGKKKNKGIAFDTIIEREGQKLYHNLNFEYKTKLSEEFIKNIYDAGIDLSKKFMIKS